MTTTDDDLQARRQALATPVVEWMAGSDTGASSKALAIAAVTGTAPRLDYPLDPADFGRCARLIHRLPDVRDLAFPILAEKSPMWAALIGAWDEIHACMEDEVGIAWTKGNKAPRTYDLMLKVRHKGDAALNERRKAAKRPTA